MGVDVGGVGWLIYETDALMLQMSERGGKKKKKREKKEKARQRGAVFCHCSRKVQ